MEENKFLGDGKTTTLIDMRLLLQLLEDLRVVISGNFRVDSIVGDRLKEETNIIAGRLKAEGWND